MLNSGSAPWGFIGFFCQLTGPSQITQGRVPNRRAGLYLSVALWEARLSSVPCPSNPTPPTPPSTEELVPGAEKVGDRQPGEPLRFHLPFRGGLPREGSAD